MATSSKPPKEPRVRLDRARVIYAALDVISERGVEGLTMRRLGQRLGVEAMAVYRYVSGREEMLEAVVEHLMGGVADRAACQGFTSWQGYLQALAHEMRSVALEHPAAFPLVASRHPAAPWLRPPLRSINVVEYFLATLHDAGFSDDSAVHAYKLFTTFLIGSLLLEVAAHGGDLPASEHEGGNTAALRDLDEAPHVRRTQQLLSQNSSQQEFEIGLEALIDRIEKAN